MQRIAGSMELPRGIPAEADTRYADIVRARLEPTAANQT